MFGAGLFLFHRDSATDFKSLEQGVLRSKITFDYLIVFIGYFSFIGFLMPSYFASSLPDFRGVLLQTGFVFNVVATIISALTVERRIAVVCESSDLASIENLLVTFNQSKAFGILLAGLTFLVLANI
jgi:hypothetical protein